MPAASGLDSGDGCDGGFLDCDVWKRLVMRFRRLLLRFGTTVSSLDFERNRFGCVAGSM